MNKLRTNQIFFSSQLMSWKHVSRKVHLYSGIANCNKKDLPLRDATSTPLGISVSLRQHKHNY